jgi:hypothetical protein
VCEEDIRKGEREYMWWKYILIYEKETRPTEIVLRMENEG